MRHCHLQLCCSLFEMPATCALQPPTNAHSCVTSLHFFHNNQCCRLPTQSFQDSIIPTVAVCQHFAHMTQLTGVQLVSNCNNGPPTLPCTLCAQRTMWAVELHLQTACAHQHPHNQAHSPKRPQDVLAAVHVERPMEWIQCGTT